MTFFDWWKKEGQFIAQGQYKQALAEAAWDAAKAASEEDRFEDVLTNKFYLTEEK